MNNLKPQLNFALAFVAIIICMIPKFLGYQDSFNRDGANDIFDKESMKTSALLLLLSATPTIIDFVLDIWFGHHNLDKNQALKKTHFTTALSLVVISLDILAKLGYFSIHLTPSSLHLSFEYLVWVGRLTMTASLMFSLSTLNCKLFPVWKTSIVTLTVASYGLLRYVIPHESNMDSLYYYLLFTGRIFLIMCVHYMYCAWVYAFITLRKWTLNDYGALFHFVVFTLLTLNFISNSIYKVFYTSPLAAVINLDHLNL